MIMGDYPMPNGQTVRVLNGYFPQGESRDHPVKFPAKEKFYQDLMNYVENELSPSDPVVIMGDMNISHQDIDIGIGEQNAKRWLRTGKCSFLPEERDWLNRLLDWGLLDTYRQQHPEATNEYSWFDYRSRGFDDNRGLRIDLILATKPLADHCVDSGIDYELRGIEKPSDHAPIWSAFKPQ
jgi:exodeoxyribonuclease-3